MPYIIRMRRRVHRTNLFFCLGADDEKDVGDIQVAQMANAISRLPRLLRKSPLRLILGCRGCMMREVLVIDKFDTRGGHGQGVPFLARLVAVLVEIMRLAMHETIWGVTQATETEPCITHASSRQRCQVGLSANQAVSSQSIPLK